MHIVQSTVNHLVNPFIDRKPLIGWQMEGDGRAQRQTAYRVTVMNENTGAQVCDTGWVESSACSAELDMQPEALTPYCYTVQAKDEQGRETTTQGSFSGAKCGEKFAAKWITGDFCRRKDDIHGAVYLRREFEAPKQVKMAVLVICGLGYFEASINGKQVGDEFLSTPLTAYDLNLQYRAFDVTEMLRPGANAIGVKLGNGYYNCFTVDSWQTSGAPWRDVPKLLCELHMMDVHGKDEVVLSNNSWKASYGPITFNGLRHGEFYDARLEMPGWDCPGFDETNWQATRYVRVPGGSMRVMEMEPIRVIRRFHPVRKWRVENGWLFDLGFAQAGVSNITYHGKAGDTIEVRYSDKVEENGELDQRSLNSFVKNFKFQTDNYTKRSDEPETWHATFTFHGFQYLEITGNDWEPELEDIEIWSLCNDFPVRGSFESSDENLNTVQTLALRSIRSMCFSVLNADTVREKLCWTGDTGLSTEMLLMNFGSEAFFAKLAADIRDAQKPSGLLPCIIPTTGWGFTFANGPDWSQPIYGIPQQIYLQTGDRRELMENYEALKRFVSYLSAMAVDGISACGLGDWCAPFDGAPLSVNMGSFKCPMPVTDTAYYYATVRAAAESAALLGCAEDEVELRALAEEVRQAFRREFFDAQNALVKGDSQTGTACMIAFGIADDAEIPALIEVLKRQIHRDNDRLDVGVLGMNALMESLGSTGNAQLAADLLTAPTYPSIINWVNMGATTLWECWNGGGSHNHHMFSCVSAFLYKYVAGIRPLAPGYEKIGFRPMLIGHTDSAAAELNTARGKVSCRWSKKDAGFTVEITVPVSCTGEVELPAEWMGKDVAKALTESGTAVCDNEMIELRRGEGGLVAVVPSGEWKFSL